MAAGRGKRSAFPSHVRAPILKERGEKKDEAGEGGGAYTPAQTELNGWWVRQAWKGLGKEKVKKVPFVARNG